VERNYKDLKTLNPKFPILIRECSGVDPQLWARYGISFSFTLSFSLLFVSISLHIMTIFRFTRLDACNFSD
jgi:hypothetical protein